MPLQSKQFIHQVHLDKLSRVLHANPWTISQASITSAETNDAGTLQRDMLESDDNTDGVHAFSDLKFANHVKRVLDVGGGQFDNNRVFLKKTQNIDLLVWDPHNRSLSHNTTVQVDVHRSAVDAVTSMSVLNVIPDLYSRIRHLQLLKTALAANGYAYIKIWPGNQSGIPTVTDTSYQANADARHFLLEVELVFGEGIEFTCSEPVL